MRMSQKKDTMINKVEQIDFIKVKTDTNVKLKFYMYLSNGTGNK